MILVNGLVPDVIDDAVIAVLVLQTAQYVVQYLRIRHIGQQQSGAVYDDEWTAQHDGTRHFYRKALGQRQVFVALEGDVAVGHAVKQTLSLSAGFLPGCGVMELVDQRDVFQRGQVYS